MRTLSKIECQCTTGGFHEDFIAQYYAQLSVKEQNEFIKINCLAFAFMFGLLGAGHGVYALVGTNTNSLFIYSATAIGAALGAGLASLGAYIGLSYIVEDSE
ncbi:MAG: hypothetical protein AB7V32_10600 [Candidatus Berkiella sp.]